MAGGEANRRSLPLERIVGPIMGNLSLDSKIGDSYRVSFVRPPSRAGV
jgi:hypothetical protein